MLNRFNKIVVCILSMLALSFIPLACDKPTDKQSSVAKNTYSITLPEVEHGSISANVINVLEGGFSKF